MRYLGLTMMEQDTLMADLAAMPDYLATAFAGLSPAHAATAGPDSALAPVEQCWHLADLEREGYGLRMAEHDAGHRQEIETWRRAREQR